MNGRALTIEADDAIGHEEHEEDDDGPAEDLCHPSPVVDLVAGVLLVLYPGHDDGEDGEEEEVAEADPEHRVGLEPLAVRRLVEVVNPCRKKRERNPHEYFDQLKRQIEPIERGGFGLPTWDGLEEGRGDLAERP